MFSSNPQEPIAVHDIEGWFRGALAYSARPLYVAAADKVVVLEHNLECLIVYRNHEDYWFQYEESVDYERI